MSHLKDKKDIRLCWNTINGVFGVRELVLKYGKVADSREGKWTINEGKTGGGYTATAVEKNN